jgi:hypothetical protein
MPLAADRNTLEREPDIYEAAPASGQVIFKGALVALNSSGEVVRGAVATTLKALGVAQNSTADRAYPGTIRAKRGVFRFRNSAAGDAIVAADYGAQCFIVDDDQVAKTDGSSTRSVAGIIRGVDAQGVWVEI